MTPPVVGLFSISVSVSPEEAAEAELPFPAEGIGLAAHRTSSGHRTSGN